MNNNKQCPALPNRQIRKDGICSRFYLCTLPAKTICEAKATKRDWKQ